MLKFDPAILQPLQLLLYAFSHTQKKKL